MGQKDQVRAIAMRLLLSVELVRDRVKCNLPGQSLLLR